MATATTRLALRKPDPDPVTGDYVNVDDDLNDNMDKIDSAIGLTICTSGTRPASPWDGQMIYETDQNRVYIRAEGLWIQVLNANNSTFLSPVQLESGASTNRVFSSRLAADANDRHRFDLAGKEEWGPGGATAIGDTNLYRGGPGLLTTDGILKAATINTGTGSMRTEGGPTSITLANTTTETTIATMTIAAGDPGATALLAAWKLQLTLFASVTATPTLTLRFKVNGTLIGATLPIVASSAVTNHPIKLDATIVYSAVGAAGVVKPHVSLEETLSVAGTGPWTPAAKTGSYGTGVTVDTTAAQVYTVTAQWSAASLSNTLSTLACIRERVA